MPGSFGSTTGTIEENIGADKKFGGDFFEQKG